MLEFDKQGRPVERHEENPFSEKDDISKAASVARGCGISYGQFMAQKYEREQRMNEAEKAEIARKRDEKRKKAAGWKPCPICKELFPPCPGKRTCSASCASKLAHLTRVARKGGTSI